MPPLETILEDLALLTTWEERYGYIIDLAKNLPLMPENFKTPATLVRGCTSQVWLVATWQGEGPHARLNLQLDSDALIVKGLLALIYAAYQGQTRAQIHALNLDQALAPTGLLQHLSPNRRSGFASVLAHLKALSSQTPQNPA